VIQIENADSINLTNVRPRIHDLLEKLRYPLKLETENIKWRFVNSEDGDPVVKDDEKEKLL